MTTVFSTSPRSDACRGRFVHGLVMFVVLGIALMHGLTVGHASAHPPVQAHGVLTAIHDATGSPMPGMTVRLTGKPAAADVEGVAPVLERSCACDAGMAHTQCVAVPRPDVQAPLPGMIVVAPVDSAAKQAVEVKDSGRPARARSPAAQVWALCISRT